MVADVKDLLVESVGLTTTVVLSRKFQTHPDPLVLIPPKLSLRPPMVSLGLNRDGCSVNLRSTPCLLIFFQRPVPLFILLPSVYILRPSGSWSQ